MKHPIVQCAGLVLAAALPAASAVAQLEGMLGKGKGELAGMAGMQSGSMGNVAGLLQYCIGNNYLSGEGATSVKDKLMGKLPASAQGGDRGYTDGQKGLLHGSDGKLVDLGGAGSGDSSSQGSSGLGGAVSGAVGGGSGGLSADLKKKACDTVLAQAKSFL